MIVYRIEHEIKTMTVGGGHTIRQGCYQSGFDISPAVYDYMYAVPFPSRSGFSGRTEYIFAFISEDKMAEYFNARVMQELDMLGYILSVYEVQEEDIEPVDTVQLAFICYKGKLLERRSLINPEKRMAA